MQGPHKGQFPTEGVNLRWGRQREQQSRYSRLLQDFICVRAGQSMSAVVLGLAEKLTKGRICLGMEGATSVASASH